jgi:hypothetical protein
VRRRAIMLGAKPEVYLLELVTLREIGFNSWLIGATSQIELSERRRRK